MIKCRNLQAKRLAYLNFDLAEGKILGLLGKNGAGKTTLIRTLLGFNKVNEGAELEVLGYQPGAWPQELKNDIGYVPQRFAGFDGLTIDEAIATVKPFYQDWDDAFAEKLLAEYGLPRWIKIRKLSEGEKQQFSIVLAMAYRPKLLILDEPVASLDPLARRQFIEQLIDNHCETGTTVVFASHITSDIERIASDVLLIKEGKAMISGDLDDIRANLVKVNCRETAFAKLDLAPFKPLSHSQTGADHQFLCDAAGQNIAALLTAKGLQQVQVSHLNLEDLFLELHA